MDNADPSTGIVGVAVALGVGLMVGIERERRKGDGDRRAAAGLRTFAIVAPAGAIAQILPAPALVPTGAVLVATLAAISHWKSRSQDPGLTTEVALFVTSLAGVLCALRPSLGAACGTGLALLLAARSRLHRFATELLSEQELHDGVLLAALALIVLPLVPSRPIEMLGGIDPRPLASMVVLIMAIQAAGHAAVRWLGVRRGLLGAGFASGFVSSTATVASFGNRTRAQPLHTGLLASAAALSAVATWVLALVMTATLSPHAGLALLPVAVAGAAGAALVGLLPLLAPPAVVAPEAPTSTRSALRPREALAVALALALVALLAGTARRYLSDAGLRGTARRTRTGGVTRVSARSRHLADAALRPRRSGGGWCEQHPHAVRSGLDSRRLELRAAGGSRTDDEPRLCRRRRPLARQVVTVPAVHSSARSPQRPPEPASTGFYGLCRVATVTPHFSDWSCSNSSPERTTSCSRRTRWICS